MYINVHIYQYIYTSIYIYININIHQYKYTSIYVYINIYIHLYLYTRTRTPMWKFKFHLSSDRVKTKKRTDTTRESHTRRNQTSPPPTQVAVYLSAVN